jgi:hypothetical protein
MDGMHGWFTCFSFFLFPFFSPPSFFFFHDQMNEGEVVYLWNLSSFGGNHLSCVLFFSFFFFFIFFFWWTIGIGVEVNVMSLSELVSYDQTL